MARYRSPNRAKAFEIYKKSKGKIKNKDIAKMLQEDPKTISKWKTLDGWDDNMKNSKNQSNKSNFEKSNNSNDDDVLKGDVYNELNEIIENVELNEKQILFCIYYIKSFNAAKAYQKAYGCNINTAYVNGPRLLGNAHIRIAISQLKQNRLNRAMLSEEDIFQKYMDIAYSDITDYMTFGNREIEFLDKKGNVHTARVSYTDIHDSNSVDGTLISEIAETRNGIKIKLADRIKALEWIADHMDMATTEQRARIEHMRNKDELDRERFEHDKNIDSKRFW